MEQKKIGGTPESGRVLLVDDNWEDFELILKAVNEPWPDLRFVQAEGGPSAIESLREAETLPALVLLDYKLPGMTGPEVVQEIRELPGGREVQVVAMSNFEDVHLWTQRGNFGIVDFLVKRISYDEFVADVRTVLARWL